MKFILSAFLLLSVIATAIAQPVTEDMLAKLPASNKEDLQTTMLAIASAGEQGLTEMTGKLAAPGSGDNTRLEYALGSFSYYTTAPGNEQLRTRTARAYCLALANTSDKENKAFIIRQLQITGTDGSISSLTAYLDDERLSDPAARALVAIHSAAADMALTDALKKASGNFRLILIQALGDSRATIAVPLISKTAADPSAGSNIQLIKLCLYALARIADPGSESILAKAAGKAGYENDPTNATDAYIRYAEELALRGRPAQAAHIAQELLTKASGDRRVIERTAALKLMVSIQGKKSLPLLTAAMDDRNAAFRAAALKFGASFTDAQATGAWLKKFNSSGPVVKGEILTMLGNTGQSAALPSVLSALKDKDASIRLRAIRSAGQIGQQQSLPALLAVLKKDDSADVSAVKDAILIMKGDKVTDGIRQALSDMPPYSKAVLTGILADRSGFAVLPADQRLLILRKEMETASTTAEQLRIVREAGKCQTFPAIVFAGNYLDNPELQQDAALAVMNIALADKTLSGDLLRKLLVKASAVLKGKDSDARQQAIRKYLDEMPAGEGIVSLFNGVDLTGWRGLVANPILRAKMDAATLEKEQQKADENMRQSWKAVNGRLEFTGSGQNLCTIKKYGD
ncbi:MAG TPA: HEAT repeat domain-containing protein, partial [Puia sp.]